MQKRLLQSLDLDETHNHTTKKIISTNQKPHLVLLHILQRKNMHVQEMTDIYRQEYGDRITCKTAKNQTLRSNEKSARKRAVERTISRNKQEMVSNLFRNDKRKIMYKDDSDLYDPFSRKKTERKQLPISKFNLSDPLDYDPQQSKFPFILSTINQKQNHGKLPIPRFCPFDIRTENSVLNSIRYSALLRPLNLDKSFQNYSTKLPEILMPRKLDQLYSNKGIFKRVQFA